MFQYSFYFRFFRFVSKQICLFRLFRNGFETPKQTETNRKNQSLVSQNKPKNNRNRLSFGLFRFEPKKKFVCFEDTLSVTLAFRDTGAIKLKGPSHKKVFDIILLNDRLGPK
jgi:hypothetical protein